MKLLKYLLTAIAAAGAFAAAVTAHAGMQICYDGATHWYDGSIYSLKVNGNEIESPMEPIIFNDHALVPVREIFEECGASVDYTGETQCVEVQYGSTYIRLYINDNTAYVNGKRKAIPDEVVPKLISKPNSETKTMVPVRFISEMAGMDVEFDGDEGIIYVETGDLPTAPPRVTVKPVEEYTAMPSGSGAAAMPAVTPPPAVTPVPTAPPAPTKEPVNILNIKNEFVTDTHIKVSVVCSGAIGSSYNDFSLQEPERVVVDMIGMAYKGGAETIETKNKRGISAIRIGEDTSRTRIVVDVEHLKSYKVTKAADNVLEIDVEVTGEKPVATQKPAETVVTNNGSASITNAVTAGTFAYTGDITQATAADSKKVIMLDAGHGGTDPGAQGTLDGKQINEKDLTLTLTYKVKAILEKNGYTTSMTRTGDTLPSLSERPEQANSEGCALFVSIHINSAEAKEAHGTEVYWSEQNNGSEYGVTSEQFAASVLKPMIKYMDSYNRGVKMANWAVIRRSEMPAILVEVGFISNESELGKLCDDDYQNKVAAGIAEGIINTVHAVEIP